MEKFEDGTHLKITTRITSEPLIYDQVQRLAVNGMKVYLPRFPEVGYGDTATIEGTVREGELVDVRLVKLEDKSYFFSFRDRMLSLYTRMLPEPQASLVSGMTFGAKANLPKDFWESLKISGTAHIVVASGMNVTLVAGFLVKSFVHFFSRRRAVLAALVGVWLYTLLAGLDAPLIRAAVMGTLALVAQESGRIYSGWWAMALSALGMLIVWPNWITDVGFMLSFCATAGLLAFQRPIVNRLKHVPVILREDLSTTLAAQIAVSPIMILAFGRINLLSPLINILVLWTVVPITVIGMIAGLVSFVFEPLARIFLFLLYPLLTWFIFIVRAFGQ